MVTSGLHIHTCVHPLIHAWTHEHAQTLSLSLQIKDGTFVSGVGISWSYFVSTREVVDASGLAGHELYCTSPLLLQWGKEATGNTSSFPVVMDAPSTFHLQKPDTR